MFGAPQGSTRTVTLVPYTSLFRSSRNQRSDDRGSIWHSPPPPFGPYQPVVPQTTRRIQRRHHALQSRKNSTEIGRAHVLTPVTNAPLVCRLLLEKTNLTDKLSLIILLHSIYPALHGLS